MKACWNLWKPSIFRPVGKEDKMTKPVASPSTRALAREKGVDLSALAAELGQDTVSTPDVERKLAGGGASGPSVDTSLWDVDHSLYGKVETEKLSRFASIAAGNLTAAQQMIPAVTHHDRADVSKIEAFRKTLKEEASARGIKLTGLAFQAKALARALQDFPRFNASLSADGEYLHLKSYCNIGIAVDTPHGLMVPVVRDVESKGLWQIASEIADLAKRAQARKIRPDEMGGASMTITNLGGIGGTAFTPIVNPPELAILGLTRTEIAPVWNGTEFVPTPMIPLDLSYDHRVINGADAARFLSHFAGLLADPRQLLL